MKILKLLLLIIFLSFSPLCVWAQDGFKSVMDAADKAYQQHEYSKAKSLYEKAFDMAAKANNPKDKNAANAGIQKCKPSISIIGTRKEDGPVGCPVDSVSWNAGRKTYRVSFKNGLGWEISPLGKDSTWIKIVEQNPARGTFTIEWQRNDKTTGRRSQNINIQRNGGTQSESTHFHLYQEGGKAFQVNGESSLEYDFSWQGGVVRCDVTGVPDGQDYQITGIDTSWMSVQKQKNCFFLFVKNNVKYKNRQKTLQVLYSSQQVNLSIHQKQLTIDEAYELEKVNPLLPIGGNLKQEKNKVSPYPIRIKYKETYVPGYISSITGNIMGIGTYHTMHFGYNHGSGDIGTFRINKNFRVEITGTKFKNEWGSFSVKNADLILYYVTDDYKTKVLKSMHFKDELHWKVYVFENGDFAIIYNIHSGTARPTRKSEEVCGYDECVELWSADGRLRNITSASEVHVYEDGIAVVKKWMGYHRVDHEVKENWKYEWEIIDRNGHVTALPPDIKQVDNISDGIITYHIKDKSGWDLYGFCDMRGQIIKKPQYTWTSSFCEGRALVRDFKTGAYEYITKSGDILPKQTFMRARPFSDGIAAVYGNDKYGFRISFIDEYGNIKGQFDRSFGDLDMRYMNSYVFCEGVANAIKKYSYDSVKYYLINKKGEPLSEKIYDQITSMRNGIAGILKEVCWGLISKNGNILVSPEKYSFVEEPRWNEDGTVSLEKWCCAVTVDSEGNCFHGDVSAYMSVGDIVDCNLRRYVVNGIHGYYNTETGLVIISALYHDAYDFSENMAAVKYGTKWGYINQKGETVIPIVFDDATSFANGYATVSIDGKKYRIDKKGTIITD